MISTFWKINLKIFRAQAPWFYFWTPLRDDKHHLSLVKNCLLLRVDIMLHYSSAGYISYNFTYGNMWQLNKDVIYNDTCIITAYTHICLHTYGHSGVFEHGETGSAPNGCVHNHRTNDTVMNGVPYYPTNPHIISTWLITVFYFTSHDIICPWHPMKSQYIV